MIEGDKDARNWAVICHLSALVVLLGVPLGNILGPLVVWLVKKNEYPFVDDQGKEALNFQISITLYWIGALMLVVLLAGSMPIFWPFHHFWPTHHGMWDFWNPLAMPFALLLGFLLIVGLFLLGLVLAIVAAMKASNGERYRYPITIRFVR